MVDSAKERITCPELYASMKEEQLSADESAQLKKKEEDREKNKAKLSLQAEKDRTDRLVAGAKRKINDARSERDAKRQAIEYEYAAPALTLEGAASDEPVEHEEEEEEEEEEEAAAAVDVDGVEHADGGSGQH